MFFKERAAVSEKIPRKNMRLLLKENKNNHIERIPIAVKNIDHLFHLACERRESDTLHLFLLSDSTRIYEDEYLKSDSHVPKNFCQIKIISSGVQKNTIIYLFGV